MSNGRNGVENSLEYALAGAFIMFALMMLGFNYLPYESISRFLTHQWSIIGYATVSGALGASLLYAKKKKSRRLQKHTLMVMYSWSVFVVVLTGFAAGATLPFMFSMGTLFTSLYLWLKWKINTEYIDPNQFKSDAFKMYKELDNDS